MVKIGGTAADSLLNYVYSSGDDLLVVLVSYSLILAQIQQNNTDLASINKYMAFSNGCRSENIIFGLEILQPHWLHFSVAQLELILDFLEQKPHKYKTLISI